MTRIRAILGLVLTSALLATLAVNAADDNTKKKKKTDGTTFGTCTKVTVDENGSGSLTVKVGAKGKGVSAGANAAAKEADKPADAGDTGEKTFTFTKDTTFEKMAGKKKKDTAMPKDCMDQRVIVTADGTKATKVTLVQAPKADN